jgi:hypothetical protein
MEVSTPYLLKKILDLSRQAREAGSIGVQHLRALYIGGLLHLQGTRSSKGKAMTVHFSR